MKRWAAIACACTLALLVTTACGGSSSKSHLTSPTVTIGATATPLPSATPRQAQAVTGIAQVDAFLGALQVEPARERRQAIEALIGYQQTPCSYIAAAGAPTCRSGEQEGTPVGAFPYKSCNYQFLRPDEIESVLILLAGATVYAVYPPAGDFAQSAEYVAIVYQTANAEQQAAAVELKGGHITSYIYSCTQTPKDYVQSFGLQDPLYQAQTP